MAVSISQSRLQKKNLTQVSSDPIVPLWNQDKGSNNRLYFGDNLNILQLLSQEPNVHNSVQLIYIDPPYATGGVFQTRSMEEAYSDTLQGDDYLDFMRKRLELLYGLLADNGSIFLHLDSIMVFHVKVMMDEIFGNGKFRGMITRQKCKPKNYTRKTFGNISDYILYYSKTDSPVWNRPYEDWTEDKIKKEYPYIDEANGVRHKRVPLHAPGIRNGATGQAWRNMLPPPGKHWQYTPDKLDAMDANNEIYWSSNGNPRRKVLFDENKGVPVQDIWLDYLDVNNQNTKTTGYPTEKNPMILQRIIEAATNKGDLVLDCFAGSGTTLAVASTLNRRWIGIDSSQIAIRTILNRFYSGLQPLGDFVGREQPSQSQTSLFGEANDNGAAAQHPGDSIISDFAFYGTLESRDLFNTELTRLTVAG
ncbi:MAG: site-specific DNA-methyltransferase [Chlorobi bacterium]|nr:MAG: DNA modification methylase [Chlorobi bacterium OLB7]MBK8911903.1 site-specific DNA-methyltransferase [Chlorobiota bacterium]MBX7215456.1 site-specific DNA-methyltransferase [Candidatus Kapabacteria bacterium]